MPAVKDVGSKAFISKQNGLIGCGFSLSLCSHWAGKVLGFAALVAIKNKPAGQSRSAWTCCWFCSLCFSCIYFLTWKAVNSLNRRFGYAKWLFPEHCFMRFICCFHIIPEIKKWLWPTFYHFRRPINVLTVAAVYMESRLRVFYCVTTARLFRITRFRSISSDLIWALEQPSVLSQT